VTICNSFLSKNHQLQVISDLKNSNNLPFNEVLSQEKIAQYLKVDGSRERHFSPEVTLWAFLSQVMDDDQSQQAAISRVIASAISREKEPPSANTSAYSQARSRLSENGLSDLARDTAKQMEENIPPEWLWRDLNIKLVDGSTLSMPDTPENQATYPQPDSQKPGIGFPIARIVAIIDYLTGAVLDLAIGQYSGKKTGEHALLRQLMSSFDETDVMLGDCYYPSFFLMAMLMQLGISGVFPMHGARKYDFRRGKRLGKKDHLIGWKRPKKPEWMEQADYDSFPLEISIREVSIETKRPGFRVQKRILVTTFLDPVKVTKSDLAELYDCRWFVELALRSIKDTMHMGILRGKTPDMVRKEIWVHLLAYNLIRKIMAQAAWLHGKKATELSFKLALQTIKAFQQAGVFNKGNPDTYTKLFEVIVYKKVGNRPGRQEPRCVKRRPKAFSKLQKPRELYKNAA
jgi:hypothetical protein